jgi:hypothetical protein
LIKEYKNNIANTYNRERLAGKQPCEINLLA